MPLRPSLLGALPALLTVAFGGGCAHTDDAAIKAPPPPPISTEVEVTGLKLEEREVLQEAVCTLPKVTACKLTVEVTTPKRAKQQEKKKRKKSKKGKKGRKGKKEREEPPEADPAADPTAKRRSKLSFTYGGTLPELRAALAGLPHPGLKVASATVRLVYEGFDNIPPEVMVTAPDEGSVHTVSEIEVTIKVPAADVAEVLIAGEKAEKAGPGVYTRKLTLGDGEQVLVMKATDTTGNEGTAELSVLVDTTPPSLKVKVLKQAGDRVVLSGEVEGASSVTVDGLEVPILSFGNFSKNLPADPDKTEAEVVATDEHGNTTTLRPKLDDGWEGAAGPGTPEA
jgi:hypothetical protein